MLCGPRLYQPTRENKLAALELCTRLVRYLIPSDPLICASYLWHNDLHDENIFVDPEHPTRITGIIDWQSTQTAPLFENTIDPGILDYDGPSIESLEKPTLPETFSTLSEPDKAAELDLYYRKALLIAYRRLIRKNRALKRVSEFQASTAFSILKLSRRVFEVGEAHLQALVHQFAAEYDQSRHSDFPQLSMSESELRQIESDAEAADAGIEAMSEIRRRLGGLWPEKGAVQAQQYDETKRLLSQLKAELVLELGLDAQDRKLFEDFWPFDGY